MANFNFNSIYVVESLYDDEEKTGRCLYEDVLRYKSLTDEILKVELVEVNSKKELMDFLVEILNGNDFPILHFEIHGEENHKGLLLNSGELVEWREFVPRLREINIRTGNNLFVTLAVCFGAWIMEYMTIAAPSPMVGFVGSFDIIYSSDILLRFTDFYDEFFDSKDLNKAFSKLREANSSHELSFDLILSENVFYRVYSSYIKTNFTQDGMSQRIETIIADAPTLYKNRTKKRALRRNVKRELLQTREKFYKEGRRHFFMIDQFPENAERYKVIPESFDEFAKVINFKLSL